MKVLVACETAREVGRDEAVEMWNSTEWRELWFAKTRERARDNIGLRFVWFKVPANLEYPLD